MMSQCAAEEKLAGFAERLSAIDLRVQETAPAKQAETIETPVFEESLLDTRSNVSYLGEVVGAALTSTVAGIAARFVPSVGLPQGIVVAGLGYLLGKKVFKSGMLHAVTRGVTIAAASTVIYPFVAGIGGSLGAAPSAAAEGSGMPYGV